MPPKKDQKTEENTTDLTSDQRKTVVNAFGKNLVNVYQVAAYVKACDDKGNSLLEIVKEFGLNSKDHDDLKSGVFHKRVREILAARVQNLEEVWIASIGWIPRVLSDLLDWIIVLDPVQSRKLMLVLGMAMTDGSINIGSNNYQLNLWMPDANVAYHFVLWACQIEALRRAPSQAFVPGDFTVGYSLHVAGKSYNLFPTKERDEYSEKKLSGLAAKFGKAVIELRDEAKKNQTTKAEFTAALEAHSDLKNNPFVARFIDICDAKNLWPTIIVGKFSVMALAHRSGLYEFVHICLLLGIPFSQWIRIFLALVWDYILNHRRDADLLLAALVMAAHWGDGYVASENESIEGQNRNVIAFSSGSRLSLAWLIEQMRVRWEVFLRSNVVFDERGNSGTYSIQGRRMHDLKTIAVKFNLVVGEMRKQKDEIKGLMERKVAAVDQWSLIKKREDTRVFEYGDDLHPEYAYLPGVPDDDSGICPPCGTKCIESSNDPEECSTQCYVCRQSWHDVCTLDIPQTRAHNGDLDNYVCRWCVPRPNKDEILTSQTVFRLRGRVPVIGQRRAAPAALTADEKSQESKRAKTEQGRTTE